MNTELKRTVARTVNLFALCLSVLFTGCFALHFGDDSFGDGDDSGITLYPDTETMQYYYADETESREPVRFTAGGNWSVSPMEMIYPDGDSGSGIPDYVDCDWLRVSPQYGSAGENEITFEMDVNRTGKDRTVEVVISCNSDPRSFTVFQSAYMENGELPDGNVVDEDLPTYDGEKPFLRIDSEYNLFTNEEGLHVVCFESNIIDIHQYASLDQAGEVYVDAEIVGSALIDGSSQELYIRAEEFSGDGPAMFELVFRGMGGNEFGRSLLLMPAAESKCYVEDVKSTLSSLTVRFRATGDVNQIRYWVSTEEFSNENTAEDVRESYLDETEKVLDVTFEGLMPATKYYINAVALYYDEYREKTVYEATTAAQESKHDMVLVVSANYANDFTVSLPIDATDYDNRGIIDWGDGSVTELGNATRGRVFGTVSHTYDISEPARFEVRYSGVLTSFSVPVGMEKPALENTLIAVKQWGYTGLKKLDLGGMTSLEEIATDTEGAFRNIVNFGMYPYGGGFSHTSIKTIPEGLFDHAVNVETFDYTFYSCENLESIPEDLFVNCPEVISFDLTFSSCPKITEIPAGLFRNNKEVRSAISIFSSSGITSVPAGLFDTFTKVETFEYAFFGCESLESIPAGLFANCGSLKYLGISGYREFNPDSRGGCFAMCKNLKSIPADLFANCPELEDAAMLFYGCSSLEEVPEGIFDGCGNLKYLDEAFSYCEKLVSVPVSMFDNSRKILSFDETFEGCRNLEGESPYTMVGETKVHIYERSDYMEEFVAPEYIYNCYSECTKLDDYADMPDICK